MHKLSIFAASAALALFATAAHAQATIPGSTDVPPPQSSSSREDCTEALGHLRRVYSEQLLGITSPLDVWVRPICVGEEPGPIRNVGNSAALRADIARHPAMREALFASNFRAEDVVGVRMTGADSLILFVYPLHR